MTVSIKEIRNIIEEAETMANMETLADDIPLTEQDVDSLDMANIYLLIEEKFDVKIPDEDTQRLSTIIAISEYLSNDQ